MSDVITNMKVRFGADTKNFKKGLDDGKQASKQFRQTAGSAFDSFAEAFGVNMGKVREGLNTVKASLTGTAAGFKAGTAGSNVFTRALGVLKAALISTGVGALVVALGSLVAYFTRTQRGADFVSRVMKSLGAVTSVLVDRFSALGEMIFTAFSNPREAISDLWEAIKTNIVNRFEGLIDLFAAVGGGLEALWKRDMKGLKDAASEAGTAIVQMTTGLDEGQQKKFAASIKGVTDEIKAESRAAYELERARQALEKREIAFIETEARYRKEIAQNRLAEKDFQLSTEQRLEANRRANDLVLQLERERKELQAERITLMAQEIDLGESMNADYRALAEEKAKLNQIEQEAAMMQRELAEGSKTLADQIKAESEAVKKLREERTKMYAPLDTKGLEVPALKIPELEVDKLTANLKPVLEEAQSMIVNFADVFNSTFEGLAVSFGETLGNIISGAEGFDDLKNVILGSLGDMAVQVGKIAVGVGIALIGIKEALTKLGGPGAIAAGVALIALGTAVKGSLSKVANGGSSGISGNSYVFDTRGSSSGFGGLTPVVSQTAQNVTVTVNGTFRQRGSDLVATINETTKRKGYQ